MLPLAGPVAAREDDPGVVGRAGLGDGQAGQRGQGESGGSVTSVRPSERFVEVADRPNIAGRRAFSNGLARGKSGRRHRFDSTRPPVG